MAPHRLLGGQRGGAAGGVVEQRLDESDEGGILVEREALGGVGEKFAMGRDVRAEAGGAGGHAFDHREGEAFVARGADHHDGLTVEAAERRLGDMTGDFHQVRAAAEAFRKLAQGPGRVLGVVAGDDQRDAFAALHRGREGVGADHGFGVLAGVAAADEQDMAGGEGAGHLAGQLEARVDRGAGDGDTVFGGAEEGLEVVGGAA